METGTSSENEALKKLIDLIQENKDIEKIKNDFTKFENELRESCKYLRYIEIFKNVPADKWQAFFKYHNTINYILDKVSEINNADILKFFFEEFQYWGDDASRQYIISPSVYKKIKSIENIKIFLKKLKNKISGFQTVHIIGLLKNLTQNGPEITKLYLSIVKNQISSNVGKEGINQLLDVATNIENKETKLEALIPILGSKNLSLKETNILPTAINTIYNLLKYYNSVDSLQGIKIIRLCEDYTEVEYIKANKKDALSLMLVNKTFHEKFTTNNLNSNYITLKKKPSPFKYIISYFFENKEDNSYNLPLDCLDNIFNFIISPLVRLKVKLHAENLKIEEQLRTKSQIVGKKKSEQSFVQKEKERESNETRKNSENKGTKKVIKIPAKTVDNGEEPRSPSL